MDQIIALDKSLQTRLHEFEEVFSGLEAVPYAKLKSEWAYYLELYLDPIGWQALWKIPRIKCEELKIPFPTVVLVYIINMNYGDHNALVRILAVQDDIHLPEKHYVPLTQLWPTKQQDKSIALNLNSTVNALDMLRFFYIHLVMPWDEDEDSEDWKGAHLLSRLRLYYDLKNGNIPKASSEHIYALLNEARRLNSKRERLVNTCEYVDSGTEACDDKCMENLVEINVRLMEIQNEINLLENELFRKVILKRQASIENKNKIPEENPHIWIILKNATAGKYIKLLTVVENTYPKELISFAPSLMKKFESAETNDTILLTSSKHMVKAEGALIHNYSIKGIEDNVEVVSLADDVMFDCIGDSSTIENVIFDCRKTQCAILVRKGHITLRNCKLIGDHSSTTHQGIIVLNGAKLTLVSCDLSGFSMTIIGNTGSKINIMDTVIHNSYSGIKIYDNCQLGIYDSTVQNCKEFGIIVETEQKFSFNGNSFGALDVVPYITQKLVLGGNNIKGDAIIKKVNMDAIENLFENPNLDPSILEDCDDDMEADYEETNINSTVLEVKKLEGDEESVKEYVNNIYAS